MEAFVTVSGLADMSQPPMALGSCPWVSQLFPLYRRVRGQSSEAVCRVLALCSPVAS